MNRSNHNRSISIYEILQDITDTLINNQQLIGIQVSIKFPDGKFWNGSGGTIDRDRKIPMSLDHLIRLGSLTKTYTAVLIFQLVERGLLSLEDKLVMWFPNFKYSNQISIQMLLNHSSGIPDLLGMKVMLFSTLNGKKKWSRADLLDLIIDKELDFTPGSDNQYSNSNYILLGLIAEQVSGKSLVNLFDEEILKPLDLTHTFFLPVYPVPIKLVTGYDRNLIPLPGWHSTEPENTSWSTCAFSSGAIAASASDVLTFFNTIQTKQIISAKIYNHMTTFFEANNPKDKYLKNFGMGLFKFGDYYQNTIGHLGLFVGSEAIALFSPDKNFILVILTNTSRIKNSDFIVKNYLGLINNYSGI